MADIGTILVTGAAGQLGAVGRTVTGLLLKLMLPGCGHWTQQERPGEVNAAMIDFLRGLPSS